MMKTLLIYLSPFYLVLLHSKLKHALFLDLAFVSNGRVIIAHRNTQ